MDKAGEDEESTIKKKRGIRGWEGRMEKRGIRGWEGRMETWTWLFFFILTWATPYWLLLGFSIVQVKQ
jgi:hypothetical protein